MGRVISLLKRCGRAAWPLLCQTGLLHNARHIVDAHRQLISQDQGTSGPFRKGLCFTVVTWVTISLQIMNADIHTELALSGPGVCGSKMHCKYVIPYIKWCYISIAVM